MIVVDTSALMAILLNEVAQHRCLQAMNEQGPVYISAGTLTEALMVGEGRGVGAELAVLIDQYISEVVPVDAAMARRAAEAHVSWGKGRHRASLNFGDCFAYALATSRAAPLLHVGEDFARTDVVSAI